MLQHQMTVEWKRALSYRRIVTWAIIIILPSLIRYFMVKDGYIYYTPIELYQELISGFIPMLFPLFMILVYTDSIVNERKNNYILYTRTRIWLPTYLWSKGIINAVFSFIVSYLLVFLPFVFIFYIEPLFPLVEYEPAGIDTLSSSTFDFLLSKSPLVYGLLYAGWVALNGVVYATIAYMLSIAIKNPFIALSIPFVWYQGMNFLTGILRLEKFSPVSTIFPFNIVQQPMWTVLIPFSILCFLLLIIFIYVFKQSKEWMN